MPTFQAKKCTKFGGGGVDIPPPILYDFFFFGLKRRHNDFRGSLYVVGRLGPYRLELVAAPPALTFGPRFNEPRFWGLFVFLWLAEKHEPNRTFLMGALFDGPYRGIGIAKTGLWPVLTIRPLTP